MTDISTFFKTMLAQGKLLKIDTVFAGFIGRISGKENDPALLLLAALISNAFSQHNETALPIVQISDIQKLAQYLEITPEELPVPENNWLPELIPNVFSDGTAETPIVMKNGLLYLGRCLQNEKSVSTFLERMRKVHVTVPELDFRSMTTLQLEEQQKQAIRLAKNSSFLLISGGPGTGKTTIVSLILTLRKETADEIILCAPTGKAQMRMRQSMNSQLPNLLLPEKEKLREIPSSTIHRLLKFQPETGSFQYNREHPLPYKLYIIDECSMIPLSLMASLLNAIPEDAAILMLGDRYQLSSVEPGSVFGDFCDILKTTAPDHIAELTVSRRFNDAQGIGILKNQVNKGNAEESWQLLTAGTDPQLANLPLPASGKLRELLRREMEETWLQSGLPYQLADSLDTAWQKFERFRILTPVNIGPFGTDELNSTVKELLGFPRDIPAAGETFLILTNDSRINLFNGDTGMLWFADLNGQPLSRSKAEKMGFSSLLVFFPGISDNGEKCWRGIPLHSLTEYTNAYAFTIHKAQGSDYDRILLLLPEQKRNFLTRELLYTGITRAKKHVTVVAEKKEFCGAVQQKTERVSGLRQNFR